MPDALPTTVPAPPPARSRVIAAFAAVYLLWGSTYLAIRFAIETMPPLVMAGVRFLVAGTVLYTLVRARGAAKPTRANWLAALIVGGLLLACGNGSVVWAEQLVPSGITALLVATVPLWMVLFDWLRPGGRRPRAMVIAGIALGLVGLVLLVQPSSFGGRAVNPVGAATLVVASIAWAAGSIYSKHSKLPPSPLLATAMEMLAGGALLVVVGSLSGEVAAFDPSAVSLRSGLALGYLVIFGSLVGFSAYVWLLRVASPSSVSTYAYVNPVVAVILGWALAGESLTLRTLLAAGVIIGAVVLITLGRSANGGGDAHDARDDRADAAAVPTEPGEAAAAGATTGEYEKSRIRGAARTRPPTRPASPGPKKMGTMQQSASSPSSPASAGPSTARGCRPAGRTGARDPAGP